VSPEPRKRQKAETIRRWLHTVAVLVSALTPPVLGILQYFQR
jgi:Na+/melibiose symporter-like transporter